MPGTLKTISPEEFENLTFDLAQKLGMKNCVWRTPGRDGGRDIQGEYFVEDMSGFIQKQIWYIECKRYASSVSWPTIWEKISYAESNSADILLIATSSSLSPQAVDEVNKWNLQRNRLVIRFWDGSNITSKLQQFPDILIKYKLSDNPSKDTAIALMPTVKILLKYSDSTYSAHVFGRNIENKISIIHSLSELITVRMSDIDNYQHIVVQKYIDKKDGYAWLLGGHLVEEFGFDKYSFRAIINYIKDVTGKNNPEISKLEGNLFVNTDHELQDYAANDLIELAILSNIRVIAHKKGVILQRMNI